MGMTRASNKVQKAARECDSWQMLFERWGQSLKPVDS
ncbi:MAG: transporter, partial [Idiomarina sp.]|nr:transporter [Idiomarina sp.]